MVHFQSHLLHDGDVEIAQKRRVGSLVIEGEMTLMFEATTDHKSREVAIAVTAGVSHAGSHENDGIVEGFIGMRGVIGGLAIRLRVDRISEEVVREYES